MVPDAAPRGGLRCWLASSLTAQALAIVLATRALLFLVAWVGLRAFARLPYYPAQVPDAFLEKWPWIDGWARWDTAHYVAIGIFGYGNEASPSHNGGLGFFPLYPMLMEALARPLPGAVTEAQLAFAAVIISNVCFLVAAPMFADVVARRSTVGVARTATLLLCISPFSYFFSAGYSESLFLLMVVASFWFADREMWWAAAVASALGTATRLVGLAIPPALLLLAWHKRRPLRDLATVTVLSPLGVVIWFLVTWVVYGDLFAYFTAQENWGGWREHVWFYMKLFTTDPETTFLGDPRHLVIVLNVVLWALWLATLPWVWRRLDPGIALLTTLLVVMQGAMTWVSLGRYLLPAIGAFIAFAWLLERPGWRGWPRDVVIVACAVAVTFLTVLFSHGFWAI
jgi:hypothetical protein